MDETKWALVSAIVVRKFEDKNLSYDTRGQKKSTLPAIFCQTHAHNPTPSTYLRAIFLLKRSFTYLSSNCQQFGLGLWLVQFILKKLKPSFVFYSSFGPYIWPYPKYHLASESRLHHIFCLWFLAIARSSKVENGSTWNSLSFTSFLLLPGSNLLWNCSLFFSTKYPCSHCFSQTRTRY